MDSREDKDKIQKYEEDDRTPCKYGTRCYQKNPGHHKKFKHPPKKDEDKEVIVKKRKSPEDSESSSSNASKVKKLDIPRKDEDSGDKTEDSKVDEKATEDETKSTEATKKDSNDAIKNDSTTKKIISDETGTNTDQKAGNSETDTTSEQEKKNTTNVNNVSTSKDNEEEEMNIEEKSTEEKNTKVEDKSTDDAADKKTKAEVTNAVKKKTEAAVDSAAIKKTEAAVDNIAIKKTETEEDSAVIKKTETDVEAATDKKIETELNKIQKTTDAKSEVRSTEERDSRKPNNEEKISANLKRKTEEKKPNVKTEISKDIDLNELKKLIENIFLVPMPSDFYKFYEFCKEVKPADPSSALKIAELKLVGPYDVLNGLITKEIAETTNLLTHWRYFYDPPEFQTIIKGNDREGLHFGYWRDRPSSDPVFVAINSSNVSHKIKPIAENIFGAAAYYIEEKSKKANPFEKSGFFSILGKLKNFAKKHNISLETQSDKMKSREKNVVARTIHGAGIVCPYNKKSQLGYRELSVTDNQLLKIVKKIDDAQNEEERTSARSELGEVVRLATIAGDECDFGTCLELGHDLLSTGCFHVQNAALAVLSIAYNQLDRQAFLKIVEAHMQNRKKSSNTSALETVSKE